MLFNKDSRYITPEDREAILRAVANCELDRILVTHGTYTIAETGRALKAAHVGTEKTILLVGSWNPFDVADSDAIDQMRFGVQTLREGKPGVHIAMDRRLWDPDRTEKCGSSALCERAQ